MTTISLETISISGGEVGRLRILLREAVGRYSGATVESKTGCATSGLFVRIYAKDDSKRITTFEKVVAKVEFVFPLEDTGGRGTRSLRSVPQEIWNGLLVGIRH